MCQKWWSLCEVGAVGTFSFAFLFPAIIDSIRKTILSREESVDGFTIHDIAKSCEESKSSSLGTSMTICINIIISSHDSCAVVLQVTTMAHVLPPEYVFYVWPHMGSYSLFY